MNENMANNNNIVDMKEYIEQKAEEYDYTKQEEDLLAEIGEIDYMAAFRHSTGVHTTPIMDRYDEAMAERAAKVNEEMNRLTENVDIEELFDLTEAEMELLADTLIADEEVDEDDNIVLFQEHLPHVRKKVRS